MHEIAKRLNDTIQKVNPSVYEMLSEIGREIYMPEGIVTQGNEAKQKATKFNATIGIATANKRPMYLESIYNNFAGFTPEEVFPYANTPGVAELRTLWKEKIYKEGATLNGAQLSNPIVTSALTHGISLLSEMFCNRGDYVVLPDMFWENYTLTFAVKLKANLVTYKTFDEDNKLFNVKGLLEETKKAVVSKGKAIVILNFPNNPSGYTPSVKEMQEMADGLAEIANGGGKILVIIDDAYFGLFFTDHCAKESMFSYLAKKSPNLLAVKLDGITKEGFAWGLRVGFMTFAQTCDNDEQLLLSTLEAKVTGLIRATVSNSPHPSQSAVLHALQSPNFEQEREACNQIIKERALKIDNIFKSGKYDDEFIPYPFNSGYFMCIKLKNCNSEELRVALLNKYQIGVISTSTTDIRVAFSSVDIEYIEELYDTIYKACKEIK